MERPWLYTDMEADESAMYPEVIAMQSPTTILAQTTAVVIPSEKVGIHSTFARQQNMDCISTCMSGSEHRSKQFERALAPGDDAAHDDRYWPQAGHGGSNKAVGRRDVLLDVASTPRPFLAAHTNNHHSSSSVFVCPYPVRSFYTGLGIGDFHEQSNFQCGVRSDHLPRPTAHTPPTRTFHEILEPFPLRMQRRIISAAEDPPSLSIGSGIMTGLHHALATAVIGALSAAVWQTGRMVGRPLGALLTQVMPDSETKRLSEPGAMKRLQTTLGGVISILLCFIALATNLVVIGREEMLGGFSTDWTWARFTILILQSVLEGEVAMMVLAGLVRIAGIS
ncbi:uncharacterized protein K489DRAFT_400779 [Dissoconium aciculare CBS 342.82]|uniref:Uncharacterized protein n=1 Tax=Dissoconium aciculare CBS 342.82 TaxID=1314786 RepID=A0A6J3M5W4_9PEZI|nr:uncharacterized protein K489DRAFT_400779 [Dissoconium aciculare CBS 342.82]KAF1823446.1 hypothetical protein K489DRAFT_400779 [Dissoconium aciculare CBS 342.82]